MKNKFKKYLMTVVLCALSIIYINISYVKAESIQRVDLISSVHNKETENILKENLQNSFKEYKSDLTRLYYQYLRKHFLIYNNFLFEQSDISEFLTKEKHISAENKEDIINSVKYSLPKITK